MGHRRGQADMSHPFPAHFGLNDFDSRFLANDPAMFHSLVFSAITFIVLRRPKDLGTEEPVLFRFERTIVDRLRFFYFSMGPRFDLLRRGDRNPDGIEINRTLGFFGKREIIFQRRPPLKQKSKPQTSNLKPQTSNTQLRTSD